MILFKNGDKFEGTRDPQSQKLSGNGKLKFGSSNSMYKGGLLDGKFHGEGQYNQNEITITGNWIKGIPDIKLEWCIQGPGFTYKGFINDCYQKQGIGLLQFDSINYYKGEFQNDKYHGQGELKSSDLYYKGNFFQNLFHGSGQLIMNRVKFTGNFEMGQFGGFGKLEVEEGVYEGEFQNNQKHGQGVFQFKNGDSYDGQWFDDEIQGKGKLTQWNKDFGCLLLYSGTFDKGCPEGEGILDIKVENQEIMRYEGNFSECLFHQKGILLINKNIKVEGQFIDGLISGECNIYFNKESQKLECLLKRNQKQGQSSMTIKDISYYAVFDSNIEKSDSIRFYTSIK